MQCRLVFCSGAQKIGIFNAKLVKYLFRYKYRVNVCPRNLNKFYTICCIFLLLSICAKDIGINPVPWKSNTSDNFSFRYWNLNSFAAHNISKLSLLEAYNVVHNFDMICLLEIFLDSFIPSNGERLNMKGYKLIRADNPSDIKNGGVGIYYEDFLAVRPVEVKNLNECLIFEMSIKNRRGYVVSLYRLRSQTQDEFDIF